MTAPSRARHLRRRRGPLLIALVVVCALGIVASVAAARLVENRKRIDVTVLIGGARHSVRVTTPATVAAALAAGQVVPRPGRLLSVVNKLVLNPSQTPPQLLVDGQPATPGKPLLAGAVVGVVEPPDVDEAFVDANDPVAPPPEPEVINRLWHPGQPGSSINRKGAVSGELVASKVVQVPMAPVPVTEKLAALTFDDGPWPTTPDVLRILREKNVKATFCVVTRQLRKDGLEATKGALGEGHHICNHTVDHDQSLPSKPQKVIDDEIRGANRQLVERVGFKPAYYRPPGGSMGPNIEATAKDEGQQVLLWSIDTKDFTKPPPQAIVTAVMANIKPGSIVLMHDGGGDRSATLAALPIVIDQLHAAGYELVMPDTVPPVAAAPVTQTTLPT